jgi:hypothetical protein
VEYLLVFTAELMNLARNLNISPVVVGRRPDFACTERGCCGLAIGELGLNEPGTVARLSRPIRKEALSWSSSMPGGETAAGLERAEY